jgi:glycerate dehydrogenase
LKIVVLDSRPLAAEPEAWSALAALGEIAIHPYTPPAEVRERVAGAGIVITNKAPVRADTIEVSSDLKFIAVTATGYDCVDIAVARSRQIPVSNVPIYGTSSVAQQVFALLLEITNQVGLHSAAVHAGEWSSQPDFCLRKTPLTELSGKVMGIVGYGRIGRAVGDLARAFGMSVIAASASPGKAAANDDSVERCSLEALFSRADVISLHCPSTPSTAGLVNRERLSLMQPTAILINTARGALVVEQDLADALSAGLLAAAAVDVVSAEPIRPENPLLNAPNCIITPHNAWATTEARARLMAMTVENVANFLAGTPSNVVN